MAHGLPKSCQRVFKYTKQEKVVSSPNVQSSYALSQRGSNLLGYAAASPHQWGAFVPGAPDVTEFPHHIFSRIQARLSREPDINRLIYSNAGGCIELRSALADYLRVARSVSAMRTRLLLPKVFTKPLI